jgi:hypothetical protein
MTNESTEAEARELFSRLEGKFAEAEAMVANGDPNIEPGLELRLSSMAALSAVIDFLESFVKLRSHT